MPTCLIIDDDEIIRRVMKAMLLHLGCSRVWDVAGGQEALALLGENSPDMIFVDWVMPGMSGPDLIKKIRMLPKGNLPKIVMFSSECNMNRINHAFDAGADDYLLKPTNIDLLLKRIQNMGFLVQ
ncbi:response regulator [Nitrospirillum pindoramense]|uniref:response regulator n=1 Tax=Nitrospirillum amazonense TaxID=28077 RepID=UPI0011AA3837|nr:response regulator [Nitrospirillum amazonense]